VEVSHSMEVMYGVIPLIVMVYISWINYKIYIVSKVIRDVSIKLLRETIIIKDETILIRKISKHIKDKL